jgi:hypothetical protein
MSFKIRCTCGYVASVDEWSRRNGLCFDYNLKGAAVLLLRCPSCKSEESTEIVQCLLFGASPSKE